MSVDTETQGIELGTKPTTLPPMETWEIWPALPDIQSAETLSPEEQRDKLRSGVLELLADEEKPKEFLALGGEITVSLHGELAVTDPLTLNYVPLPRGENARPVEAPDNSKAEKSGYQRKLYTIDYLDLVEALKDNARQMATRDFGDPADPTLPVSAERRAEIAQAIDDVTKEFMYKNFDEQLAVFLLSASLTGDIVLQMNPTDTATAMRQEFMWLDQVREKLSNAHDANGVSNVSKVKVVLVPFKKRPNSHQSH